MKVLVHGPLVVDDIYYVEKLPRKDVDTVSLKRIQSFGGTGGNVSLYLSALGLSVFLTSITGSEEEDNAYLKKLKANDIDVYSVKVVRGPRCMIFVDKEGEKSSVFSYNDYISCENIEVNLDSIEFVDIVGGLPTHIKTILNRKTKETVFYSPGPDLFSYYSKDDFECILDKCDFLFANNKESKFIFSLLGLEKINDVSSTYDLRCFIRTLGKKGSELIYPDDIIKIESDKIETVIDTVGCGDAYHAGFVYGTIRNKNHLESAKLGNRLSSESLKYPGAQKFLSAVSKYREI